MTDRPPRGPEPLDEGPEHRFDDDLYDAEPEYDDDQYYDGDDLDADDYDDEDDDRDYVELRREAPRGRRVLTVVLGIFAALRRDATVAVVITAEPVGSAPITFYGQVDTLYTANLSVRSYFIPERRPLGAGFRESVSFTAMGAATKAEEAIDPRLDRLLGDLAAYRRRRG